MLNRLRSATPVLVFPALVAIASPSAFGQDSDGDGVPDAIDAFPCDPTAAGEAFAPAEGQVGMVVFEDQWPSAGDLDFNDVVLSYHYRVRLDPQGRAIALHASFDPLALGGASDNGLGLRLPVGAGGLASVQRRVGGGALETLSTLPGESSLTVVLSDNLRELFGGLEGQINSEATQDRLAGALLELEIRWSNPVVLGMGSAPFDLFIFRASDVGLEIHRPEYQGTARMNPAYFGTLDDASTPSRAFVDHGGLPFALVLPASAPYPAEAMAIDQLFPSIVQFASSGGAQAQGFYQTPAPAAAYRDRVGQGPAAGRIGFVTTPADTSCFAPILSLGSGTFTVSAISNGSAPGACSSVPLSNLGSASATGIGASFSGSDAANFQLCSASSNPCGTSLAAGASCNLGVRLAASTNGSYGATLNVTSSQGASTSRGLSGAASGFGVIQSADILGFYGSYAVGNSWAAIVRLTAPIHWTSRVDFNNRADAYCVSRGFVGVVKTRSGAFSTHPTYYLQTSDGIIAGNGPSNKVTRVRSDGPSEYTNVYTNRRNVDSSSVGDVGRTIIGNDASTIDRNITSPTSGDMQAVLCQTMQPVTSEPVYLPDAVSPMILGFYGSNYAGNHWAAIVRLDTTISWTDRIHFNNQVDAYCAGLGFLGVVKTRSGSFSTHATYYLQTSDGIIAGSGPSNKLTRLPPGGPAQYTNVYTNRRNTDTTNGNVGRATIGNDDSTIVQTVPSPTTGDTPAVLCQTRQPIESEPAYVIH